MSRWSVLRPYVAGVLIALAVAGTMLALRGRDRHETLIAIEPAPEGQAVTVFVGGAVAHPGVYTLNRGDRVDAAIAAAGGLSDEADPDAVNRALKLRDEAQIIVPRKGAPRPAGAQGAPSPVAAGGLATTPPPAAGAAPTAMPAPINVNTAPAAELERLPGVGPRLAQQIVDYRAANGPFNTPADLAKVKGISDRMVASWADLITYGP